MASFTEGINNQCRVKELVEAKWVKARRETTQVFMITFKSDKLPEYIRIHGEADRTRVYEYKDRPILCKKCNRYGHTEKRCLMSVPTCGRCAGPGHRFDSTTVKCSSCGGVHVTVHSTCPDREKNKKY